jgi:FAD:protein FMN transferase
MQSSEFRAMNCAILLAGEGDPNKVETGFRLARYAIQAYEKRFTRFSDTSELAEMNRVQGQWAVVSTEMFELLWLARRFHEQTDGLFDPGILNDLLRLGYDRSFDLILKDEHPYQAMSFPPTRTSPGSLFSSLQFARDRQAVWMPPGLQIDLGGIAKGWIVDQAAKILSEHCTAGGVSAGGDMRLFGLPDSEAAWPVEIEDPLQSEETAAILHVGPGAVATSAITKRAWRAGGVLRHHLIDPRLGLPAEGAWLSVTAIAADTVTAEVYAKALLIAGPRQASEVLASDPGIAYLAIDRQGEAWGSQNFQEFIYEPA